MFAALFISLSSALADVRDMPSGLTSLDTVSVGNPGNAADIRYATPGYGSVGYSYHIGKYEVTAGQYCEFLNAVAKTDTYGLYNSAMWTSEYGCKIERQGTSGNYTYSVALDYANRPVNYVSWGDAARFANWLHNDQPTGGQDVSTTEDGAYTLNGAIMPAELQAVTRNANWKWAIPSADEWYKAAYHKNDGVTGNYWDYPTSSDSIPSNILGDPIDPGNNATYYDYYGMGNGDYTIGGPYWRTEVGAHENSDSPYGTFDQGGNLWEWNEAALSGFMREVRGGSFNFYYGDMHASHHSIFCVQCEGYSAGLRVVYLPDTKPPSVPTEVQATALSWNTISVSWAASTDNIRVTGYRIYRNGSTEPVGTSTATSYIDIDLQPETSFVYRVSAYDGERNESDQSVVATATTLTRYAIADFDCDSDVDLEDFGFLQGCYSVSQAAGNCVRADLDHNGLVSQADFMIFQSCLSGANVPADVECGL